jgi:hypothetical protein
MKRLSFFFFLVFIISLVTSSCGNNTKTFAQSLDEEQALINAYIKRNNINVLSSFPKGKWGDNDYVKTSSGLYFHLVDSGNTAIKGDTIKLTNTVVPRFKQYALALNSDTIFNWTTIDYAYSPDFSYGTTTESCKAFHEAVSYMKRNDSQAKLIVPSSLGFSAEQNSVTPYGYTFKIKFLR